MCIPTDPVVPLLRNSSFYTTELIIAHVHRSMFLRILTTALVVVVKELKTIRMFPGSGLGDH